MIRKLMPRLGRFAGSAGALRPPQVGERKSVLVIDDQAESLGALESTLADSGLLIESAGSAESALRRLADCAPDVILLNPDVRANNGTRLARRLLADQRLAAVPIAALRNAAEAPADPAQSDGRYDAQLSTAASSQELHAKLRELLAACLVPASRRHFDLRLPGAPSGDPLKQADRLLHAVEQELPDSQFDAAAQEELRRMAEVVKEAGELAHRLGQASQLAAATTARARAQFRSLLRYCRDLALREDPVPGLAELRISYLEHRHEEMDDLERALNAGDYAALRKSGHNLKGMGAAYGFGELTELGKKLELAAKDSNGPLVEATLDRIEAYLTLVEPPAEERGEHAAAN